MKASAPTPTAISAPSVPQRWSEPERAELRVGVSACLLGQMVRYDGGHCRDRYLTRDLGAYVEWVPVCPEVEVGMTTPRPTLRLVDGEERERLLETRSGHDHTEAMRLWADRRVRALRALNLDGYVLKRNSPSCGMERVRVHSESGARRDGVGVFARALMEAWPELPIEEEGRLNDPRLREYFIERLFARSRWRRASEQGWTRRRLVEFHTQHKLLLRVHDVQSHMRLGRIVASLGKGRDDRFVIEEYEREFHACMNAKPSVRAHVDVLLHAMGHMKRLLDSNEKRELLVSIEDYRRGILPLVVPVSLISFQVRKHGIEYLANQVYFAPHPKELMLRNHC